VFEATLDVLLSGSAAIAECLTMMPMIRNNVAKRRIQLGLRILDPECLFGWRR
jgi:hypothetical protein